MEFPVKPEVDIREKIALLPKEELPEVPKVEQQEVVKKKHLFGPQDFMNLLEETNVFTPEQLIQFGYEGEQAFMQDTYKFMPSVDDSEITQLYKEWLEDPDQFDDLKLWDRISGSLFGQAKQYYTAIQELMAYSIKEGADFAGLTKLSETFDEIYQDLAKGDAQFNDYIKHRTIEGWDKDTTLEKIVHNVNMMAESLGFYITVSGAIKKIIDTTTPLMSAAKAPGYALVSPLTAGSMVLAGQLKNIQLMKGWFTTFATRFLTTSGEPSERAKGATFTLAATMTPFMTQILGQHIPGVSNIPASVIDSALNMLLSSNFYKEAFGNAKTVGEFLEKVVPQLTADIGMALQTRYSPEVMNKKYVEKFVDRHAKMLDITPKKYKEMLDKIHDTWKKLGYELQDADWIPGHVTLYKIDEKFYNTELARLSQMPLDSYQSVGKLGDFLRGTNTRHAFQDILDTQLMIANKFTHKGIEYTLGMGNDVDGIALSGIYHKDGKPLIVLGPGIPKGDLPYVLAHEAFHVKDLVGGSLKDIPKRDLTDTELRIFHHEDKVDLRARDMLRIDDIAIDKKPAEDPTVPKEISMEEFMRLEGIPYEKIITQEVQKTSFYQAHENLKDLLARNDISLEQKFSLKTNIEKLGNESVSQAQVRKYINLIEKHNLHQFIKENPKAEQDFKTLLQVITGKDDIKEMTQIEAKQLLDTLDNWTTMQFKRFLNTASDIGIDYKSFLETIPSFQNVSWFTSKFAPMYYKIQHMGEGVVGNVYWPAFKADVKRMELLENITKEANAHSKILRNIPGSRGRVWRFVNNSLEKGERLTVAELETANWLKRKFEWFADELGLSKEFRKPHYITHIMNDAFKDIIGKYHTLPNDMVKALTYGIGPSEIKMPFLEKREGLKDAYLKQDWLASLQAYSAYAARKIYFDPVIRNLDLYYEFMPEHSREVIQGLKKRLTGNLSADDKHLKDDIRGLGEKISKIKGLEPLGELLTKGNVWGNISHYFAGLMHMTYLGFVPRAVIRNAFQSNLTIAMVGTQNFMDAAAMLTTSEGKKLLENCYMKLSRHYAYAPEMINEGQKNLLETIQAASLLAYKAPDINFSVPVAFLAGYLEAQKLGLPDKWAALRGEEVAHQAQYGYTKISSSFGSSGMRMLGVFTSWPLNYSYLLKNMLQGKESEVYLDYARETGTQVRPHEKFSEKYGSAMKHLAVVAVAYTIQAMTDMQATQYVGVGSPFQLASSILEGNLPAIQWSESMYKVMAEGVPALLQGDTKKFIQSLENVSPYHQATIRNMIIGVKEGTRNPWELFFYLQSVDEFKGTMEKLSEGMGTMPKIGR